MIPIVGSVAVVVSIGLLIVALLPAAARPEEALSVYRKQDLKRSTRERVVSPILGSFSDQARRVTPSGMVLELERLLALSGALDRWPLELVLAAKFVLASIFGMGALAYAWSELTIQSLAIAAAAMALGFYLPNLKLKRLVDDRQEAVSTSLPEVLDQLTVIVEAGLGFDSALAHVVEGSEGPLIDEFRRAIRAIRMGVARGVAFEQIAERTDVSEVRQFISAIRQADALGVPLARVLRTQSNQVRELQRLASEEAAMRLPVKLTFPLVLCILPALFVLLLGPVALRIAESGF